jgi:acyl dehydratase
MRTIEGIDGLRTAVGTELGISRWLQIDQAQISAFADVTGDHYWLHTDPKRAATTPHGSTIAHGLLTLSLGPLLSYEIYEITGFSMHVNYGFGKVRWTAPVAVGSRVRLRAQLEAINEVKGGVTCTILQTFELDGSDRPACVAESLLRVVIG